MSPEGARKKALVPGCGPGYDAVSLSKLYGYDVVGLDISQEAISLATYYLESVSDLIWERRPPCKNRDDQKWATWMRTSLKAIRNAGNIKWVEGDFFSDGWLNKADTDKFDLIYDFQVSLTPTSCATLPFDTPGLLRYKLWTF